MSKLDQVREYFEKPESRIGYNLVMKGSKHFGFHPIGELPISEEEAQVLMQDLLAQKLELHGNCRILDAGCGQGVVASYLAKNYGCSVHGITIVPFEVENARKRAVQIGVDHLTNYDLMDYSNTSFEDGAFDAVYTTEALVHSPNVKETLAEFYRILKPGGRMALFEYTLLDQSNFLPHELDSLNWVIKKGAMHSLRSFDHVGFCEILSDEGFVNVTQQDISENTKPSYYRLHKLAKRPYRLIRALGLQRFFVNTTCAMLMYDIANKGLFRYCIFTAQKPKATR